MIPTGRDCGLAEWIKKKKKRTQLSGGRNVSLWQFEQNLFYFFFWIECGVPEAVSTNRENYTEEQDEEVLPI